jgi:hypothetical protein
MRALPWRPRASEGTSRPGRWRASRVSPEASRFVPLLLKPSSRLHPPQPRPRLAARRSPLAARRTSFLDRPITLYDGLAGHLARRGFDVMNMLMTRHSPRSTPLTAARRGRLGIEPRLRTSGDTPPPCHRSSAPERAGWRGTQPGGPRTPGPPRRPDSATTPSRGQPYSSDGRPPTRPAGRVGGQRSARTEPQSVRLLVGGLQSGVAMLPLVAKALTRMVAADTRKRSRARLAGVRG